MLDAIRPRTALRVRPHTPPPPVREPIRKEAAVAQRVAATPAAQHGARARFAAIDAPARMYDVPATSSADRALQNHAAAVRNAPDDDARDRAVLAATAELPRLVEALPAAERARFLADHQSELRTIAGAIDHLDGDETKEAIGGLGRAAELAGPEGAIHVARPFADVLQAIDDDDGDNLGEIEDALKENAVDGHGALLGAALVAEVSEHGDVDHANGLAEAQREGLQDVHEDFDDAREKADHLDAILANQVGSWQGTLTPEQIQAGVERFMSEHAEDYAARDEAAGRVASTLPGAAYTVDHPVSRDGLNEQTELVDESSSQLATVPSLVRTESGTRAVADALAARGRGERTFLDAAVARADDPVSRDAMENALLRAAAVRGDELAREGRLDEVPDLLRGAGALVEDAGLRSTLDAYGDDVAGIADQGLPPERAARALLQASTTALNQAPRLGASPLAVEKFAALARGLGIGAVALAGVSFANDPGVRTGLETLSAALPASVAFTSGATRALLSKAGLAATIAFSAFDTASALSRGDYEAAALAAAPAAGAAIGAGIGVWAFGVGAIPGAIIGGAIGTVVQIGGKLLGFGGDDPIVDYEEDAEPFLRGALAEAGLPEDAAHRLRDVDGDLIHVGQLFPELAERLGTTPQELFAQVARLPDDEREDFVKAALKVGHNGDDIKDAFEDEREPPALAYDAGDLDDLASRVREDWPALA